MITAFSNHCNIKQDKNEITTTKSSTKQVILRRIKSAVIDHKNVVALITIMYALLAFLVDEINSMYIIQQ